MNISVKSKLYAGIGLLAGFVILLWMSGSVFINTLAENSGAIIQDNIRSVSYAQQMEQALNDLYTSQVLAVSGSSTAGILGSARYQKSIQQFEELLDKQQANITETGEQELSNQLQENFENLIGIFESGAQTPVAPKQVINQRLTSAYHRLQQNLSQLTTMNVDAIHRKNTIAQETASSVTLYMSVIGALCSILGILMLIRFPGYIVDPIRELIRRIKEIANRNYDQSLELHTGDEYEDLAEAFNQMARKLQEYENSNIDRIMSEKKRVETIINHMGDAVIGLDADNDILFANNKAIELIGYPKKEIVGEYAPDLASRSELFHEIMKSLSGDHEEEVNYLKIGNQNEHYFSIDVVPVPHQNRDAGQDTHLGNIITLKNVTRFHEMDQAKTNFISVVSHELKTPISSINMSLRLLGDQRVGMLNEEQRELISSIKKDVRRMKQTTSDLLDLSKIESGNIQLNTRDVSPEELLEYAYETMIMQAFQKDISMDINVHEDLPQVQADSQKTVWVLVNLISNAIRYTGPGGQIILEGALAEGMPKYVQFAVKDTGEGIAPEDLDKIFDKYYQVDKDQKDRKGSGLGLAIAKEFIMGQGGRIWVESTPGAGSIFYFTLPVSKHSDDD
ncbi:ATP-binding protein [Halalkalibaculum sp. DA384]|uniref:HAMP domain-containing sensor histidine kinase n=1 Tax=Halalkalibaculum sp. DA384 TaxID=3373606 RepID=UPI00375505A9